jgi:general secretion pathway protein F
MPVYLYKALTTAGKTVKGNIDADSVNAAKRQLRLDGFLVTEIAETRVKERLKNPISRLLSRENTSQLALLCRQLATLLKAGLPVVRSFTAIMEQLDPGELKDIISAVRDSIREGDSMAQALRRYPQVFPGLMTNMIEAGESGGALDLTLGRLADYYEGKVRLRNQLRATLAYPVFMVLVGTAVLLFLFIFLIPRVTAIFDQMKTALPLATRILIGFSNVAQNYWYVLPVAAVLGLALINVIRKNEQWMKIIDRGKLELPLVGNVVLKLAVARFARTLGTLLAGGVSLFQALGIVRTIMSNRHLAEIVDKIKERVGEGGSLTANLKESGVFPPVFLHMVGVGEETGELEKMMIHVADTFESEVDRTISAVTSLLEPVMILAMGLVVGLIVIAILLPIFEMSHIIK